MKKVWQIWTDGGSRGNPGEAAIGWVIKANEQLIDEKGEKIGVATNNEAEYLAFIASLNRILDLNPSETDEIIWQLDSLLVVQQLNGVWKIKDQRMKSYFQTIDKKLHELPCKYKINHIPREQNSRADQLVNEALDTKE